MAVVETPPSEPKELLSGKIESLKNLVRYKLLPCVHSPGKSETCSSMTPANYTLSGRCLAVTD